MLRTKWTVWSLVLLCICAQASAQIAHQQTESNSHDGTTLLDHTAMTPSGSNVILISKVSYKNASDQIASVRWRTAGDAGDTLTYLRDDVNGDARSAIYYLINPAQASRFVRVSFSTSVRVALSASIYTGVHQTTPFSSDNGANGTGGDVEVSVTSTNDEMAIDCLCQVSAGPHTATADHTQRANLAGIGGGTDVRHASQEKLDVGPAILMHWIMSGSDNWALSAGILQPAATERARRFWGRRKW